MRTEDQRRSQGNIGEILDENGTLAAQIVDDEFVMYDFVPHVDRRSVQFQCALDDLDGAINAGAKATWVGEQDFGFTHLGSTLKGYYYLSKLKHGSGSPSVNA